MDRPVAELMSAYPTSGGMYFVTKHVFPPDKVPLAAWVIGWSNFLGQTAGAASVGYSVAQMVSCSVNERASIALIYPSGTDSRSSCHGLGTRRRDVCVYTVGCFMGSRNWDEI